MWNKTKETADYLIERGFTQLDFGIVLGTGLGNFTEEIQVLDRIPYSGIPHFPVSTVEGHHSELILGTVGDKRVMALRGRFHYYEGWSMREVTFPVRVMKMCGIGNLIVSNASGGVNPKFRVGDLMLITDHINMIPEHPLRGANEEKFGPRFVDMHEPYDRGMIKRIKEMALQMDIPLREGVYLALQGPTFETPAEYRMVKMLGADAVGMSTVPEVIVAKHMGMKCMGLSVITDLGIEGNPVEVSHEEVQKVAHQSEKIMGKLVRAFIEKY